MMYVPDYEGDRLGHRRWHHRVASTLPPRPDKRLGALRLTGDLLVDRDSPRWQHRMVYERAHRLKLEQHYDFTQWKPDGVPWEHSAERPTPPHAVLLIEQQDIAVGVVSFINGRRWSNVAPGWLLSFIWIAPEWRRQGVLSRRWPAWRATYGEAFMLEPPLSEAMEAFALKHHHPIEIKTVDGGA